MMKMKETGSRTRTIGKKQREINQDIIINFPAHPHYLAHLLWMLGRKIMRRDGKRVREKKYTTHSTNYSNKSIIRRKKNLPSHNVPIASSDPSSQWFTLSHSKSGLMQNSFVTQRKSLHECSVECEACRKKWKNKKKRKLMIETYKFSACSSKARLIFITHYFHPW